MPLLLPHTPPIVSFPLTVPSLKQFVIVLVPSELSPHTPPTFYLLRLQKLCYSSFDCATIVIAAHAADIKNIIITCSADSAFIKAVFYYSAFSLYLLSLYPHTPPIVSFPLTEPCIFAIFDSATVIAAHAAYSILVFFANYSAAVRTVLEFARIRSAHAAYIRTVTGLKI